MRLSEAIRLGAMIRPQGHGGFFVRIYKLPAVERAARTPYENAVVTSCALGAAYEAIMDAVIGFDHSSNLRKEFPILLQVAKSPVGSLNSVEEIIVELNDMERWTREQIADWVEQIEVEREPQLQDVRETASV